MENTNIEKFKKLGIEGELLRAIERENFENPSEIQEKSIPLVLAGNDVIAESATGSGKTLAFGSGIIQNCSKLGKIQALVLVPTRELAEQVSKSLDKFSEFKGLEIVSVYGGVDINPQMKRMRYADVVVGTPGRILDHIERKTIYLAEIKMLVLDEADRMLDMGFIRDIEKIIRSCNKERQTLLFSATVAPAIVEISKKYMRNAKIVSAENRVDPTKLAQSYYDVMDNEKFSLLVNLLKGESAGLVMVFCNTKHMADSVAHNLTKHGIDAAAIHGDLSQNKRNRIMEDFKAGKCYVLVCTDVAARGLDIQGVSHVYNFDVPIDADNYVHRIGRTARAGKNGKAITILGSRDYENFSKINGRIAEVKREENPKFEMLFVERPHRERRDFGGRSSGGRGGGFSRGRSGGSFGRRSSDSPSRGDRESEDSGHGERRSSRDGGQSDGFRPRRNFSSGGRRFGGNRNFRR
jgi:ATP-dependent RNA helicase DeaD